MPMQPRPRAETSRFCPRVRFCIVSPMHVTRPDESGCCCQHRPRSFKQLTVYESLQVGRVSVTLHFDGGDRIVDGGEIVGHQLHVRASKVLLQAMKLRCSRNGYDPGFLSKKPSQRNLRLRRLLLIGDLPERIHHVLICFTCVFGEAWYGVAEVCLVELRLI